MEKIMKKSILISLISIISIGAQAQTYKMGPMVEKTFPYDTMEYWEADSLGKTKVVDTIFRQFELRLYKNKVVFKSGKNKIVYKIDKEWSHRGENLDALVVINKKTKIEYSMLIVKLDKDCIFILEYTNYEQKTVNAMVCESIK
jgi:hypothetical protein